MSAVSRNRTRNETTNNAIGQIIAIIPAVMKSRVLVVAAACIPFVVGAGAATAPTIDDRGRAALSNVLRARVARGDVPAVVAAVVNREDVVFIDAFGKR